MKIHYNEGHPDGSFWTSPEIDVPEERHAVQGVVAGYYGQSRWATEAGTGRLLHAIDRQGKVAKAFELAAVDSVREITGVEEMNRLLASAQADWSQTCKLAQRIVETKVTGAS